MNIIKSGLLICKSLYGPANVYRLALEKIYIGGKLCGVSHSIEMGIII